MSKMRIKFKACFCFAILIAVFFLTGCNSPADQLQVFNRSYEYGDFQRASKYAEDKIKDSTNPKAQDLLWSLQAGAVERVMGNYDRSTKFFDDSEDMLKIYDEQSRLTDGIFSIASSDNLIPYRGQVYDGVMINTYKGLNFMFSGNLSLARVEFNRALDRQRRAKEVFNEEIARTRDKLNAKNNTSLAKKNLEDPNVRQIIADRYPNIENFRAYPDFVNPFATYISGLFFAMAGDYSKSADLLKETYGMVPDNPYIAEDLKSLERYLDGGPNISNTVWVIFENGIGPYKSEFRIDLPLFVANDRVNYFGIALPVLENGTPAQRYLDVISDGVNYKTLPLANMNRVIRTEFNKDFEAILIRAIVSASAKIAAQYAMQKQDSTRNSAVSILMSVYSAASTAADLRIWTSLPKDFQIARFPLPKDNKIAVNFPGRSPMKIDIPDCENAIVYIKQITPSSDPALLDVMVFNKKR